MLGCSLLLACFVKPAPHSSLLYALRCVVLRTHVCCRATRACAARTRRARALSFSQVRTLLLSCLQPWEARVGSPCLPRARGPPRVREASSRRERWLRVRAALQPPRMRTTTSASRRPSRASRCARCVCAGRSAQLAVWHAARLRRTACTSRLTRGAPPLRRSGLRCATSPWRPWTPRWRAIAARWRARECVAPLTRPWRQQVDIIEHEKNRQWKARGARSRASRGAAQRRRAHSGGVPRH